MLKIREIARHSVALLKELSVAMVATLPNDTISCWIRRVVYNFWGCHLAKGCLVYRNVLLLGNVTVGKGSSISNNTSINGATAGVYIGDDVMIAPSCCILAFEHGIEDNGTPMIKQPLIEKRVTIQNDVWIAANCTITSGVTVGQGAIVAANAVVTKDVDSYAIVAGVPARFIKSRRK